jgi:hypothetical protein
MRLGRSRAGGQAVPVAPEAGGAGAGAGKSRRWVRLLRWGKRCERFVMRIANIKIITAIKMDRPEGLSTTSHVLQEPSGRLFCNGSSRRFVYNFACFARTFGTVIL